jgi:hypothetical protein
MILFARDCDVFGCEPIYFLDGVVALVSLPRRFWIDAF